MVPRLLSLATSALLCTSLAGCGLIFNGSRQSVMVQSNPDAAKLTTTPATADYTTPVTLSLERKHGYSLRFERDGYSPATLEIQQRTRAGIVVLDVLLTGLIGVIVDATTGAWNALSPRVATVTLTKIAVVPGPDTITVGINFGKAGAADGVRVQSSVPGVLMHVTPSDVSR